MTRPSTGLDNSSGALKIPPNGTPAKGAVVWYSSGHVGYVEDVNSDGSVVMSEMNYDFHNGFRVRTIRPGDGWPTGFIHIKDLPSAISDGQFVSYQGHVYRIAGGAPIYVSAWANVGGDPGTTRTLSDGEWGALVGAHNVPADGTFISTFGRGEIYTIAGGAPIYVTPGQWNQTSPKPPVVVVDQFSVDNAGGGGVLNHLNYRPVDGTFIGTVGAPAGRGEIYTIAGGAPIYVTLGMWNQTNPKPPVVTVSQEAVDSAGGPGAWSHLNYRPVDGTFIGTVGAPAGRGEVFIVAGGAPIYISLGYWNSLGVKPRVIAVSQEAVDSAGGAGAWSHLSYRPGDGSYLTASGKTYRTTAGAPILQATPHAGTAVDPAAIENAGGGGAWSHLAAPPAAVTVPSVPQIGAVVPGDGAVMVGWGPPSSDGGSPVMAFEVLASPGGATCATDGTGNNCIVTGLGNGTSYSFQVRARNAVGWSAWSTASASVSPKDTAKCAAADVQKDGRVDVFDLSMLLSDWNTSASRSDPNADGKVDVFDLSIVLSMWGPCPVAAPQPAQQLRAASVVSASALSYGVGAVLKGLGGSAEVLAQASDGTLFGQAAKDLGSNGQPVVWSSVSADPLVVSMSGARDLVFADVNAGGLAVGTGLKEGSDDQLAWYRSPNGTTGVLDGDGASKVVAHSVDESGRIAGFLMKDVAVPVVWDSVTAAPRYLPLATGDTGGIATAAAAGAFAGATRDDRLALWNAGGALSVSVADGEAIDMNDAGMVLFGSATDSSAAPRVRLADGNVVGLPGATDAAGRVKRASAISAAGAVVGSYGDRPVLWPAAGQAPGYLPLPEGATSGRALGFGTSGRLVGWAQTGLGRVPVVWQMSETVTPPSQPPVSGNPPTGDDPSTNPTVEVPTVTASVKAVSKKSKVFVDVNPNKGKGYWTFKVQYLKKDGTWGQYKKTYKTKGKKETRTINLKRGTYRIVVKAKYGHLGTTSAQVYLKR